MTKKIYKRSKHARNAKDIRNAKTLRGGANIFSNASSATGLSIAQRKAQFAAAVTATQKNVGKPTAYFRALQARENRAKQAEKAKYIETQAEKAKYIATQEAKQAIVEQQKAEQERTFLESLEKMSEEEKEKAKE